MARTDVQTTGKTNLDLYMAPSLSWSWSFRRRGLFVWRVGALYIVKVPCIMWRLIMSGWKGSWWWSCSWRLRWRWRSVNLMVMVIRLMPRCWCFWWKQIEKAHGPNKESTCGNEKQKKSPAALTQIENALAATTQNKQINCGNETNNKKESACGDETKKMKYIRQRNK